MAHAEKTLRPGLAEEKTSGNHLIQPKELKALTLAYEKQFSEHFPISAKGMTAVHRALGIDHTGRVDVAVNPDSPEGIWLREYLDETGDSLLCFPDRDGGQGDRTAYSHWTEQHPTLSTIDGLMSKLRC